MYNLKRHCLLISKNKTFDWKWREFEIVCEKIYFGFAKDNSMLAHIYHLPVKVICYQTSSMSSLFFVKLGDAHGFIDLLGQFNK